MVISENTLPLHHQIIVELKNNIMNNIDSNTGEIVMYQPDETIRLEVRVENETVWLTQQQISDLFLRDRTVINRHINNVFKEGECDKESNVHFLHIPNIYDEGELEYVATAFHVSYFIRLSEYTNCNDFIGKEKYIIINISYI